MRYLKITSAENPDNDYIELNDFNGYLCTSFTTLGISRKHETLEVGNRQFSVSNKPKFKDYNLTVYILTNYSDYEQYYHEFIDFFDRNKLCGFRLYYNPYNSDVNDSRTRYILCDIETIAKTEKREPITLTVKQNSLWLKAQEILNTNSIRQQNNVLEFAYDKNINDYCMTFKDANISTSIGYYCVEYYLKDESVANFTIHCYNEIPLNLKISAPCHNPIIQLYKQDTNELLKTIQIYCDITEGDIEINSQINENGIWFIHGEYKDDFAENLDYSNGSPYWHLGHGDYYIKVSNGGDTSQNIVCKISYNEEYSE